MLIQTDVINNSGIIAYILPIIFLSCFLNVWIFFILGIIDLIIVIAASAPEPPKEGDVSGYKDWVFINYTFKRFEGLTQRGVLPSHMKK